MECGGKKTNGGGGHDDDDNDKNEADLKNAVDNEQAADVLDQVSPETA
jgi:hypothetical protein